METNSISKLCLFLGLVWFLGFQLVQCTVTYDRKAIVINGQRRILISGSIHYPRSTPEVPKSFPISLFFNLISQNVFFPLYHFCGFFFSDLLKKWALV